MSDFSEISDFGPLVLQIRFFNFGDLLLVLLELFNFSDFSEISDFLLLISFFIILKPLVYFSFKLRLRFDFKVLIDKLNADLPKWKSIDDVIEIANGDKDSITMIKTFWQPWADKIENCNGRIKALRSFFEQQLDLLDKLVSISW